MSSYSFPKKQKKILVFSKTAGYRHGSSIVAGKKVIVELGQQNKFEVDTTENANDFTAENLKQYAAVVFLCTTGNVLNEEQQKAFEQFIRNGGGYLGLHSAADTEYDWAWFGELNGAYFKNHPSRRTEIVSQPPPVRILRVEIQAAMATTVTRLGRIESRSWS